MPNVFKKVIDRLMWVSSTPAPNAHTAAVCVASDLRNDVSRNPYTYQFATNAILNRYNINTKSWHNAGSPGVNTLGAGSCMAFVPSFSAQGTIAAGATTTSIPLTTALPAAVGVNSLGNRGGTGEYGYKIRIIGNASAGSSGKTEERFIIANTGGTNPTLLLDSALSFTPASGDRYELLSGRVFVMGSGAIASNSWRAFNIAVNTGVDRSSFNLPTIGTDSSLVVLDEQYTPFDCLPGEGMVKGSYQYDTNGSKKSLTATATALNTLTGHATGGDAAVAVNEYRNFQIRIVEDTTTPLAVGQRRIISSHTVGASPVYTLGSNWTTTPSSTAKYVIEQPNLIIMRTAATTQYVYNYTDATINNGTGSIAADAWSTTYFAAAANAAASGVMWMPSFGIRPESAKNSRHSFLYCWRGGTANLDLFDIAGAATGTWTNAITFDGSFTPSAQLSGCYAPFKNEGRMFYLNSYVASQISQIWRFDVQNRMLTPYVATDEIQSGTAAIGNRMACYVAIDGTDSYDVVFLQSHLATRTQELIALV